MFKKILKGILIAVSAVIFLALLCIGTFIYETEYKVTRVDTSISDDGHHEIVMQRIGDADFPFGSADGRFILKENGRVIEKRDFTIYDDGGQITADTWDVSWYPDRVEIVTSASEQDDELFIFYWDD